ncbi:MAG: aromatic ring-hydroxylating oxygenase subunit alpha [Alphaproteobacteria bacterium]
MAVVAKLPPIRRPLDEDPEASYTLPARWYHDPAVYEREMTAIFHKTWHYVGHASQVAAPGDYVTGRVADQRVMVVRGRDGRLRGFHNTCQHRGHQVLSGAGNLKLFMTCPYHAWAYDTEGKLRTARNCEHVAGFRKEDFGLVEVRVEEFCAFLFVNLDRQATPLAELVPDFAADLRARVPNLEAMRPARECVFGGPRMKANWKVVVDNYVECYHCGPSHPAFADILDMARYRQDDHGLWSRQIGVRTRNNDTIYPIRGDDAVQEGLFWFLWPATTINLLPGNAELNVLSIVPRGVESSSFTGHQYSTDGTIDEARFAYMTDVLAVEDKSLCESVQEGLHSLAFDQGRFIVDRQRSGISEHAMHRFHLLVKQALEAAA